MRLAKYGKQLRENYRAFKNKQCEQNGSGSPKEQYSSYNVSNNLFTTIKVFDILLEILKIGSGDCGKTQE
ncbi:hypothetical protein EAG_01225 [Camponotus floridanus]|uniref:Uncharacterized protein n=1 Tax=Camponotus floridanus TaxID=104421 RepID=E2A7P9_CAMFO|nr:hypothetical protein EAG_01225 [Camponotus floridanus]